MSGREYISYPLFLKALYTHPVSCLPRLRSVSCNLNIIRAMSNNTVHNKASGLLTSILTIACQTKNASKRSSDFLKNENKEDEVKGGAN